MFHSNADFYLQRYDKKENEEDGIELDQLGNLGDEDVYGNESDNDSSDTSFVESDEDEEEKFTDEQKNALLHALRTVIDRRMKQWSRQNATKTKETEITKAGTKIKEQETINEENGSAMREHTITSSNLPLQLPLTPQNKTVNYDTQVSVCNNGILNKGGSNFFEEIIETKTTTITKTITESTIKRRAISAAHLFNSCDTKGLHFTSNGTPMKAINDVNDPKPQRTSKRRLSYSDDVQQVSKQAKLEITVHDPEQKRCLRPTTSQSMVLTTNTLKKKLHSNSIISSEIDYKIPYKRCDQLTYRPGVDENNVTRSIEKAKKGKLDPFKALRAVNSVVALIRPEDEQKEKH